MLLIFSVISSDVRFQFAACAEPNLAWKTTPSRADMPWLYDSVSWAKTASTGRGSCSWVTCTGLSPHLPPCLTPFLLERSKSFKRWAWKWIFLRIRNKSQQGTNNIKILHTVRNWSKSSCCDVRNGHSMWAAIKKKKNWKKKYVFEKQLLKTTENWNVSWAESVTATRKPLGLK